MRLILLFLLIGSWTAANDYNKDVFDKLCDITKNAKALLTAHQDHSEFNRSLHEAIYGSVESARFDDNGDVKLGKACSLSASGRSELCNYKKGAITSSGKNGCFADSLFGTFLCLCTPGSGDDRTLCGFGRVGGGVVWLRLTRVDHERVLFKEVWKNIKEQCTGVLPNMLNNENKFESLKTAVKTVTGSLKEIDGYLYLGDGGSVCSGTNKNDFCVAYEKASEKKGTDIPWVKRIYDALEDLQKILQQRQKHRIPKPEPTVHSQLGDSVESVEYKERSDNITNKSDEKDEEAKGKTNTVKSQSISREDLQRRKRNIQKSTETNIASLATDHNEDSTSLTNTNGPLLATLLI
ncbi:Variant surface glycoprotein [Trypanosoma congolense IL3000]|uniref:Variant surface glycoprotein n=1 Tax=Trypanosoma congolense (strain IL3000) TaxID=1068625 RepID=F9W865_TRYCI|nr:Variant surface glycoprotein [Trypanosoma congolense IL3000]